MSNQGNRKLTMFACEDKKSSNMLQNVEEEPSIKNNTKKQSFGR